MKWEPSFLPPIASRCGGVEVRFCARDPGCCWALRSGERLGHGRGCSDGGVWDSEWGTAL